MAKVYLGLGTNLGDKEQNLHSAILYIEKQIGSVVSLSAFYNSEPWGLSRSIVSWMRCCVWRLICCHSIYFTKLNRLRYVWGELLSLQTAYTVIVLWILIYCSMTLLIMETPQLVLPHPLMNQRVFVMEPLAQIAPDLKHPVLHSTMAELLKKRYPDAYPSVIYSSFWIYYK